MERLSIHTGGKQRGATAVAFLLFVVLLLGFVAFALDVGRLYVSRAELQNAADSCALSASAALTGANANQLEIAEAYGIAAGTRNLAGMQETAVSIVADKDVTFSETLSGAYQTKTAAAANALNMRYAKCSVSEADISPMMIQVIEILSGKSVGKATVQAAAVGSLEPSISNCALPLAICKADVAGKEPGTWIQGVLQAGSGINGAFKWIEYPGYERNKDLAALLEGKGQCDLNSSSTVESHPGFDDNMLNSWNTRFGVYKNPLKPADAPPDMTGWVYNPATFPEAKNAMADFLQKRAQATPKHQESPAYTFPNNSMKWASDEEFQKGQDRRLVVGPIVDCNELASSAGKVAKVEDWACYLMLNPVFGSGETMYLEYRGLASDISSGCVTSGAPGGPSAGGPKVPTLVQ